MLGIIFFMLSVTMNYSLAQGFSPETKTRLRKIIDSFQNNPENKYVGGLSVAINVDSLALWQWAKGYAARNVDEQNNLLAGGSHLETDTLFRIYSITKTFTAALTLKLAKQGFFNLDEPIITYLPLLGTANPTLNTSVTIRQLLAHESGYSDYTAETDLQIAVAFAPTHIWNAYEMASYIHQLAEPGTQRRYSSSNYVLLGAIIEAATGKPVEELFRKRFFDELDLSSMYFGGRESIGSRGDLASPHDNISPFNPIFEATGQPTFPDAYTNISRFPLDAIVSLAFTGGAVVSNVADVAAWGNALFSGRAAGKSIVNTMINSVSDTVDEDEDRLGYGVIVTTKISESDYFIGHDGNAPGYRSIMFYQPGRKMTIAILTNYHGANLYDVAKALYAVLPSFVCGSKKDKVIVCFKGVTSCMPRSEAAALIGKGAYLGACDQSAASFIASSLNDLKIDMAKDKLSVSPNPVTSHSTITFTSAASGMISLGVYDVNGQLKATLFNSMAEKGAQRQISFEAGKLTPGIYVCRLQTPTGTISQKIVVSDKR
jgi:D-alanyl-D-alanine carboxypeptidase